MVDEKNLFLEDGSFEIEEWFPEPRKRGSQHRHGLSGSLEYSSWASAQARCMNRRSPAYSYYGGRGITFAKEWLGGDGFLRFLEHIGPRPSLDHTLDRIDVNGNYEPGNVRWATWVEQANNKRNSLDFKQSVTRTVTAFGVSRTISEWAGEFGCDPSLLAAVLKRGR